MADDDGDEFVAVLVCLVVEWVFGRNSGLKISGR